MKVVEPINKKTSELRCPFCGQIPSGRLQAHMKACIRKNNITYKDYREITAQVIIYNWPEFKSKEFFAEIYSNNSIPDFQKKYGTYFDPRILCYYYNIPPRSCRDAGKMGEMKRERFYENKYGKGITNPLSKGTPSYYKRNNTVLQKYGVKNVFCIPEIIERIQHGNAFPDKYNCTRSQYLSNIAKSFWRDKSYEERVALMQKSVWKVKGPATLKRGSKGILQSSLEARVAKVLVANGIPIETQFCLETLKTHGRQHTFFYDFLIKDLNVLLEINGNYWHANPAIYKATDLIEFPGHQVKLVSDIWARDRMKKEAAVNAGYQVIYIWESEIKESLNLSKLLEGKLKEIDENIHFKEQKDY